MTWRLAAALTAVLLIAALVPAIRHLRETPPPPDPPVVLVLPVPAGTELGSGIDRTFDLAISPSGREVVFAATAAGDTRLWRRPLDSERAEPLAGSDEGTMPAIGPNGDMWFFAARKLRALERGAVRDVADAPGPSGISVRSDGAVLFAPIASGPIKQLAAGRITDATTVRDGERGHTFPQWNADGGAFVYLVTRDDGRRELRLRTADDDRALTATDSHGAIVDGHLVHVRESTLVAEPLQGDRLGPRAKPLAFDVGIAPSGAGAFAVGGRILAYGAPSQRARELRWYALDGRALASIVEPGDFWQARLSPDGRTVAVTARDPLLRTLDIFTVPASGGALTRFTLSVAADRDPVWSPDGRRLAFRSYQNGQPNLFAREFRSGSGNAGPDEPLLRSPLDEVPTDWTADGLLFHARTAATGFDIFRLPAGGRAPVAVAASSFNEVDGRTSPDGRWLAYASDESGQFDVYVVPARGTGRRVRVSTSGGTKPQWTSGGLVFVRGDEVMRADIRITHGELTASVPAPVFALPSVRDCAVAPDGARLLGIAPTDRFTAPPVRVIVGWRPAIDRR